MQCFGKQRYARRSLFIAFLSAAFLFIGYHVDALRWVVDTLPYPAGSVTGLVAAFDPSGNPTAAQTSLGRAVYLSSTGAGRNWAAEEVMAISEWVSGRPGFAFNGATPSIIAGGLFMTRDGGATNGMFRCSDADWSCETLGYGVSNYVGAQSDLVYANGVPIIAYDSGNSAMHIASRDGNGKGNVMADKDWNEKWIYTDGIKRQYPALALYNGKPIVFYYLTVDNGATGELMMAYCSSNCGTYGTQTGASWTEVRLDNASANIGQRIDAEVYGNSIFLTYEDRSSGGIRYATCSASCLSAGSWQNKITLTTLGRSSYPALTMDANGHPRIAYYDTQTLQPKIASCDTSCDTIPSNWARETVDTTSNRGGNTDLLLDANGLKHVFYGEGLLYHAGESVNVAPTATVSEGAIVQGGGASGLVTFQFQVNDANGDKTKARVEYSIDGTNWYRTFLVPASTRVSTGIATTDNAEFSIGAVDAIDTDSGTVTVTTVWDTKNAANGSGAITVETGNMRLRVQATDGELTSVLAQSDAFSVDNAVPSSFTSFRATGATDSTVTLTWGGVTDTNFTHYTIWYGTDAAAVRGKRASAWDERNDTALASSTAGGTVITGLSSGTVYYFFIEASDRFGNATQVAEEIPRATARQRRPSTPAPIPTPTPIPVPGTTPPPTQYPGDANSCPGFSYSRLDSSGRRYCQLNSEEKCNYNYPGYLDQTSYNKANCPAPTLTPVLGTTPIPVPSTTPPPIHTWTFLDGSKTSFILARTDPEYTNYITSIENLCRTIKQSEFVWSTGSGDASSTSFGIPDCTKAVQLNPTPPPPILVPDTPLPPAPILESQPQTEPQPYVGGGAFVDETKDTFAGAYENMRWNAESNFLELDTTKKQGTYTSQVHNVGKVSDWKTLAWTPNMLSEKALPNDGAQEAGYPEGNADMTGNVLLLHMDEAKWDGTADEVRDASGNGNNGKRINGANTNTEGKVGRRGEFNGTNDYVDLSKEWGIGLFGSGSASTPDAFTVEAWLRPGTRALQDKKAEDQVAVYNGWGGEFNLGYISKDEDSGKGRFHLSVNITGEGWKGVTSDVAYDPAVWYHVIGVYSRTERNAMLFVDGVPAGTASFTTTGPLLHPGTYHPATIGAYTAYTKVRSAFWKGAIDEVAVYRRALSEGEVRSRYTRSASTIRLQVRSCDDSVCAGGEKAGGEKFVGPDGTANTYYEETRKSATGLPEFSLSNVPSNQYFQYRIILATDKADFGLNVRRVAVAYDATEGGEGEAPLPSRTTVVWKETSPADWTEGTKEGASVTGTGDAALLQLPLQEVTAETITLPTTDTITAARFTAQDNGWAVGNNGTILHWNGNAWSTVSSPTLESLWGLTLLDKDNGWAVGNNGTILHWNGSAWSASISGTTSALSGVAFTAENNGWAVGDEGTILHWNGSAWSVATSGTTTVLYGVAFTSANDGWAVGNSGTILHWDGNAWSAETSPTSFALFAIGQGQGGALFAVGDGGVIVKREQTGGWVAVPSMTPTPLLAFASRPGGMSAVVGDYGEALESTDGSTWASSLFDIQEALFTVAFAGTDQWMMGTNGAAFRVRRGAGQKEGTFTSAVRDAGVIPLWQRIQWEGQAPAGTTVRLQFATSNSMEGPWQFVGPDGTARSFYTDANKALWAGHGSQRFARYRVLFTGDGESIPTVDAVSVFYTYDPDALPLTPTPLAPKDAVLLNSNPVLSWSGIPPATEYIVEANWVNPRVSADPVRTTETQISFTDFVFHDVPVFVQESDSIAYSWRVRAEADAGVKSDWSSPRTFTIDTKVPEAPAPVAPEEGATFSTAPTFQWSAVTDANAEAISYTFTLSKAETGATPLLQFPLTGTTFTPTFPLSDGTYLWGVSAKDKAGNTSAAFKATFTVKAPVPAPTAAPFGLTTEQTATELTLRWQDVPLGGDTYTIEVAHACVGAEGCEEFINLIPSLTQQDKIIIPVVLDLSNEEVGDYFVRVLRVNEGGRGPAVQQKFTVRRLIAPTVSSLVQTHVLWRNDDGDEQSATKMVDEDTAITDVRAGIINRLRAQVANEGETVSGSLHYALQYAIRSDTSCDAVPTNAWATIPTQAAENQWGLADSTHFIDGALATNLPPVMSDPEGAAFINGALHDTKSRSAALALNAHSYTEFEYAFSTGADVASGATYCFRLVDAQKAGDVEKLQLTSGQGRALSTAVIDAAGEFLYFGTFEIPAKIIKIRLSDFSYIAAKQLTGRDGELNNAVIDTSSGFAYFTTQTTPQKLIKIRLSDLAQVGSLTLTSEEIFGPLLIDNQNKTLYAGILSNASTAPARVEKIRLTDFTIEDTFTFNDGEIRLQNTAAIDAQDGLAYFIIKKKFGFDELVKVRLSDFSRIGSLSPQPEDVVLETPGPLAGKEHTLQAFIIDAAHNVGYLTTTSTRNDTKRIVAIRLSDFTRVTATDLTLTNDDVNDVLAIDRVNGFVYIGTGSSGILQVRLSDMQQIDALNFGFLLGNPIALDNDHGAVYVGTLAGAVNRFYSADATRTLSEYRHYAEVTVAKKVLLPEQPVLSPLPEGPTKSLPAISWAPVANAARYEVTVTKLSDDSVRFTETITQPDDTTAPMTATLLNDKVLSDGEYLVKVLAVNTEGKGNDSSVASFVFDGTAPDAPELNTLSMKPTSTIPSITWLPSEGASSYTVVVTALNDPTIRYSETLTQPQSEDPMTRLSSTLLSDKQIVDGTYTVAVTVTDEAGNTKTSEEQFVLDREKPVAPTELVPTGTLEVSPTTLSWSAVSDITDYRIVFAKKEGDIIAYNTPLFDDTVQGVTFELLSSPSDGTYGWRMYALDAAGNESDPIEAVFTVKTPVPPPTSVPVDPKIQQDENTVTMQWGDTKDLGNDTYSVLVSHDGDFSQVIDTLSKTGLKLKDLPLTFDWSNEDDGTFYARFYRENEGGRGPITTSAFVVARAGVEELLVLDGWGYEQTIKFEGPTPLNEYQAQITLDATFDYTNAAPDGADLRFVDADGNVASYWIEQWNPEGASTIWVSVPLKGTRSLDLYYGNSEAEATSNVNDTFEFFDDFNVPDAGGFGFNSGTRHRDEPKYYPRWTVQKGTFDIKDGTLRNWFGDEGGGDTITIDSIVSRPGYAVRSRVLEDHQRRYPTMFLGWQGDFFINDKGQERPDNYYFIQLNAADQKIYLRKFINGVVATLAEKSIPALELSKWYAWELRWESVNKLSAELWGNDGEILAVLSGTVDEGWITGQYGFRGIRGVSNTIFDDVLVRKYSAGTADDLTPLPPSAPRLLEPANKDIVDALPKLTWEANSAAVNYTIDLRDKNGVIVSSIPGKLTPFTTTKAFLEIPASALKKDGVYTWRVRVKTSTGLSDWSETPRFTLDTEKPEKPQFISAQTEPTQLPVTLEWSEARDAISYVITIMNKDDPTITLIEQLAAASELNYTISRDVLPGFIDGEYIATIVAEDVAGNQSAEDTMTITIDTTVPEKPVFDNLPTTPVRIVPNLEWNRVEGASAYDITVTKTDDLSFVKIEETITESSGKNIRAKLLDDKTLTDGTYNILLVTRDAAGNTVETAASFTIVTPPNIPELSLPDNEKYIHTLPTLSWNAATGATSYVLTLKGAVEREESITATSIDLSSLSPALPDGEYMWSVTAKTVTAASEPSVPRVFTLDRQSPQSPINIAPENGSLYQIAPRLAWENASQEDDVDVSSFTITVTTDADINFDQPISSLDSEKKELFFPSLGEGKYRWHVVAHDKAGNASDPSSAATFTIAYPTDAPLPLSPQQGETVNSTVVVFQWTDVSREVRKAAYNLTLIKKNAEGGNSVITTLEGVQGTEANYTFAEDGEYEWTVVGITDGVIGTPSAIASFTIDQSTEASVDVRRLIIYEHAPPSFLPVYQPGCGTLGDKACSEDKKLIVEQDPSVILPVAKSWKVETITQEELRGLPRVRGTVLTDSSGHVKTTQRIIGFIGRIYDVSGILTNAKVLTISYDPFVKSVLLKPGYKLAPLYFDHKTNQWSVAHNAIESSDGFTITNIKEGSYAIGMITERRLHILPTIPLSGDLLQPLPQL
ncbi:MAG: DUF2341 domain-containing protein [bacterium]|nr:DUF2341 domain-containing protein [bacterium]